MTMMARTEPPEAATSGVFSYKLLSSIEEGLQAARKEMAEPVALGRSRSRALPGLAPSSIGGAASAAAMMLSSSSSSAGGHNKNKKRVATPSPSFLAELDGRAERGGKRRLLRQGFGAPCASGGGDHPVRSLSSLCLDVVVAHLERYAPESFAILGEEDFNQVIRLRHDRTSPLTGSGGLDGSGRVAPAVPDRFLSEVEAANPHLAESAVADRLVWRDCVNFRFREGGLTRPPALLWPWPILVEKVRVCAEILSRTLESPDADDALRALEARPMNVPLLQATGAGKTVKRAIRAHKKRIGEGGEPDSSAAGAGACARLERLLGSWVAMADDPDGIAVGGSHAAAGGGGKDANSCKKISESLAEARGDLRIAEGCRSWRQLFRALKLRDDSRRSDQGERMRKIRSNLARERPRVVKVRPAAPSARRDRILARPEDRAKLLLASPSPASAKMSQLRRETAVTAVRQQRAPSAPPVASRAPPSGSFGAAVAFAAAAKRPPAAGKAPARAGKATTLVRLPGGREMRVPGAAASGRRRPHPPPPATGATHKSKAAPGRR
jgi:hypothetical protein